jgi:hypothetical protein
MIGRAQCPPSIYKGQLMNERIKELAKQAGYSKDYLEIGLPSNMEKFAQLIVQECASHCDLLLDHKISSEWSRGTHDCSRAIKKHFGVEE